MNEFFKNLVLKIKPGLDESGWNYLANRYLGWTNLALMQCKTCNKLKNDSGESKISGKYEMFQLFIHPVIFLGIDTCTKRFTKIYTH